MQSRKERHQHEIKNAEAIEKGLDPFADTMNSGNKGDSPRKKRKKPNRLILLLLLLVIVIGLFFGLKVLLTDNTAALDPNDTTFKTVKIPSGSTPSQMAKALQKQKVIKSSEAFYKYSLKHGAEDLQAGTYKISPSQNVQLIFKQLTMGPNAGPQLGKGYVLVATGQDQAAIAKNIASETKLSQDKVNKAFSDKSIISKMKSKYPDLLKNMSSKSNLADYVYPAAYDLNKVTDVTDLMTKLLATSDKQLKSYYKDLNKDGINKPAVITLMATSGKSEFEHRLAFVNTIAPYAQTLSKKYGILASIAIAQAAHESNWDNSKLSSKYNNYFGVKTQDETAGKSVVLETTEYVDGKPETQKARFAVYSDWKDSMKEHAETLVNGNTWNPNQFQDVLDAKNYKEAAKALYKDSYATDVNYPKLIINLIETWNLQRFDK